MRTRPEKFSARGRADAAGKGVGPSGRPCGFTLAELMVVIAIIVLVSMVVLPSINKIFNAGADAMALNLFTVHLDTAQSIAQDKLRPAGVHCQMVDADVPENANLKGRQFMTIVEYSDAGFRQSAGYRPQEVPGNYALGEAEKFRTGTTWNQMTAAQLKDDFTCFTVVYDGDGEVVTRVNGDNIIFDPTDKLFVDDTQLWAVPAAEEGVMAITVFDYVRAEELSGSQEALQAFLNESGQYLPIHLYTGLLFERK